MGRPPLRGGPNLRYRLLLKPGGFQSIGGLVKEGLEAKQLAASDLKENPNWLIERDAAPPAVETDMAQRCDAISAAIALVRELRPDDEKSIESELDRILG